MSVDKRGNTDSVPIPAIGVGGKPAGEIGRHNDVLYVELIKEAALFRRRSGQ